MSNKIETRVRRHYKKLGYRVLRNGWPDFLMFRETVEDFELVAVEAKSRNGKLTMEQFAVLEKLSLVMCVIVTKEHSSGKIKEYRFGKVNCGRC